MFTKENTHWRGRTIDELSREELKEALCEALNFLEGLRDNIRKEKERVKKG